MASNIEMKDLTSRGKGKEREESGTPETTLEQQNEVVDNTIAVWAWLTASLYVQYIANDQNVFFT